MYKTNIHNACEYNGYIQINTYIYINIGVHWRYGRIDKEWESNVRKGYVGSSKEVKTGLCKVRLNCAR